MFITWPDMWYHSSQDTPDKQDPTQYKRAAIVATGALAVIATGGDEMAARVTSENLGRGSERMGESAAQGDRLPGRRGDARGAARRVEGSARRDPPSGRGREGSHPLVGRPLRRSRRRRRSGSPRSKRRSIARPRRCSTRRRPPTRCRRSGEDHADLRPAADGGGEGGGEPDRRAAPNGEPTFCRLSGGGRGGAGGGRGGGGAAVRGDAGAAGAAAAHERRAARSCSARSSARSRFATSCRASSSRCRSPT